MEKNMFNLKKAKAESVLPYEKRLEGWNEEYKLPVSNNEENINSSLEDTRKDNDGMSIYEKMLDKVRKESDVDVVTEKQLNKQKDSTRGEEGEPITDYGNVGSKKNEKDFDKAKDTKGEEPFYDKFLGEEYIGENPPKQVGNVQKSQLLSNYKDREAFRKANPSIKKASLDKLVDCDALIYHFYKQAFVQNRDLNNLERKFIDKVNKKKIEVLAQFQEELHPNLHQEEKQLINSEDSQDKDAEFKALADYENSNNTILSNEEVNETANFGSPEENSFSKKKPFFGINDNLDKDINEDNVDRGQLVPY
jgi:hypothetical protein